MIIAVVLASAAPYDAKLRDEECGAALYETSGDYDDDRCAYDCADHAVPTFAKGGSQGGLAHRSRGRAGPIGVVELQPKSQE